MRIDGTGPIRTNITKRNTRKYRWRLIEYRRCIRERGREKGRHYLAKRYIERQRRPSMYRRKIN